MKRSSSISMSGRRLALWLGALCALFCSALASAAPGPFAFTEDGALRGARMGSVDAFLGVPYAKPPVGDFRWRAPRPAGFHFGVLNATQFAPHCSQSASPFGVASTSEDCLYLNVYAPRGHDDHDRGRDRDDRDHHNLPVMVWIHGGALVTGESDDYDPTALIDHGVIVVTINYRLGALGFLVHPALAADGGSSDPVTINYGIRDQQTALEWVQHNIRAFGGDPHNVTVFGESAGGLSTLTQIVSPRSHGLLDKAIVESGAYSLALPSVAQSEVAGGAFATAVGCSDQSAACLRAVPVATILTNQSASGYVPTVDNAILPLSLGAALAAGKFNRVPVIQGSNHDEWRLFIGLDFDLVGGPLTPASYAAVTAGTFGAALAPVVLAEYPVASFASPDLADAAQGTDSIFACTGRIAIRALSQFVPVFAYEFSDPNAPEDFLPPVSFPYAAAHASEIQYIFNLRASIPHPALTPAQQKLSDTMVSYWSRFAKDSDPNERGTSFWPRYTQTADEYQSLVPGAVMPEFSFSADHKCAFWTPILTAIGD